MTSYIPNTSERSHYTTLTSSTNPRIVISELMKLYYKSGWVSGTGGGISIRHGNTVWIAPSGVHKERVRPQDIFEIALDTEEILFHPMEQTTSIATGESNVETQSSTETQSQTQGSHVEVQQKNESISLLPIQGIPCPLLKVSECKPLFFHAFRERNAGAVIHSHALAALMTTLICTVRHEENQCEEFCISQIEMIKGIKGHGYYDTLIVPVIANTAREHELSDELYRVMKLYPKTYAVLVKRHGVYIWGDNWEQCKTHAECYHYLFEAAVEMKKLGLNLTPQ